MLKFLRRWLPFLMRFPIKFLRILLAHAKRIFLSHPLLVSICIIAAIVRIIGLLPNDIYNADEAYIRVFASDTFYNAASRGDFDPHTYKYGSFIFYIGALPYVPYMIVLYLFEIIQILIFPISSAESIPSFSSFVGSIGSFHESMVVLFMQRLSIALMGVGSVYLVYRIAYQLFLNTTIAYVAAFIMSVAPLHVRDSHYLTTDVPFTFFILLAVYAMIRLMQTGRMKWYVISGLLIGFATTVRYFPIVALAYPVAVLLDEHKTTWWLLKIFNGVLYMIIGVALGVPFLLINGQTNIPLFITEMNKYVLPWYQTSLSTYVFALVTYVVTLGVSEMPPVTSLVPGYYDQVYVSLLLSSGFGLLVSIVSIIGLVLGLFRYPKRTIFLLVIPLFLFIYISSYIPAKYDRLAIPLLPFLALFAGIFFDTLYVKRLRIPQTLATLTSVLLLIVVTFSPIAQSFGSSIDCSRDHPFEQSVDWIDAHIPEHSTAAFKTHLPFPSKDIRAFEIRPDQLFFLEESRQEGAEYAFINHSALIYFMGQLQNDFIVIPPELEKNFFVNLSFYEYESRATLLHAILTHDMCAQPNLYYFQLPESIPPVHHAIHTYTFDNPGDLSNWHVQKYTSIPSDLHISHEEGALAIKWRQSEYVPPRVMSEKIAITPGEVYTLSGSVKISEPVLAIDDERGVGERDGFLRIDFYDSHDADTSIPGFVTALTPRTFGEPQFRQTSVTLRVPEKAEFAIISLQVIGTKKDATYWFDNVTLSQGSPTIGLR